MTAQSHTGADACDLHTGCTDTARESALKVDSGVKPLANTCQHCNWLFNHCFTSQPIRPLAVLEELAKGMPDVSVARLKSPQHLVLSAVLVWCVPFPT